MDLTKLDATKIPLPLGLNTTLGGLLTPLLSTVQSAVLAPLIAALPPIEVPGTLVTVKITPKTQVLTATSVLQQGPHVAVSLLGQSLVDVVLGEARVSGTDTVDCTPAAAPVPPASAADLALACTSRRLVLVDVLTQGSRVKLLGAADRKLTGKTVNLRLAATGKVVATAKVAKDGSFNATAPLPPKQIRGTDKARYQASVGREKSLDLKLSRRLIVSSLTSKDGEVKISGRVTLPLAKPLASITLTRRLSCRKSEVVRRFKPNRNGTFSVTVDAPDDATAAVYRMSTVVRRTTRSTTTSPTYTLPRGVNLDR